MKKKTIFIWRESVYMNDFKCNICGNKVAHKTGEPMSDTLVGQDTQTLYCSKCMNPVAYYKRIKTKMKPGLHGHISNFEGE